MSEKTRAELKEQIKIMNHNYQVIKEMHEKGYQHSVGEIKRLTTGHLSIRGAPPLYARPVAKTRC